MMGKEDKVKQIYKDIRALADEWKNIGKKGERFSILHAPIGKKRPCVLIVGERPGPTPLDHDHPNYSEEDSPPCSNLLATRHYPYSIVARGLFADAGAANLLKDTQSTDVSFFRVYARALDAECEKKFYELVKILAPRTIVAVGSEARKTLCPTTEIGKIERYGEAFIAPVVHFSGITRVKETQIRASVEGLRKLFKKIK